jgi:hypothetical protein
MQRLTPFVILAALFVAGCESGSSTGPQAISFTAPPPPSGQGFVALYAPPVDVGPYPSDIYNPVAAGTGPVLHVPVKITSPLAAALNTLDGFSTTARVSAPFNAPVDASTLVPWNPLSMAPAAATVLVLNVTNPNNIVPLLPGVQYDAVLSTAAGADGAVLEIVPLAPLAPRSRYAFILTNTIEDVYGVAAAADQVFAAVRDTHLAGGSSVPGVPALDPLFPAIAPLIDLAVGLGLSGSSVISAWTMTTESIGNVLEAVDASATAGNSVLAFSGVNTKAINAGLPGIADLYVGYIEVPYYGDPQDVLNSFWVNTSFTGPPTGADPVPFPRVAAMKIPLLASLPNASSGQTKPSGGWPVVIYQHGVTDNRLSMIAIADSFASQGYAVVAIDLPLHGITDATNPFYQGPGNPANPFGNNERHFFLDNVNASGLPFPDGQIDNGIEIFNVANPLNARDHIRQANSDLIHLTRTIPTLDFDGGGPDLDADRIHMVTMSLGSIFAGVFLGLDTEVTTATMSSPAGPWTSILTDPEAVVFGAPIRAALAAQGLVQGTTIFDNFVRDLQTILDPADPTNYAAAASANHPLHVLEILGDTSVPNDPTDYLAALWGAVDVTPANTPLVDSAGVRGIVRFTSGSHTSLLSPAANPAVTAEMQAEMVTFAVTGGTTINITNTSVVQ